MRTNTRTLLFAALFTALTAIGAFIKIPIPPYPIPMTLQTAFLFLAGLLLEARPAFLSQAAYVMLGLLGIPIFTNGGGIHYVFDPTFGYLLAFLITAPLLSLISERTLYRGKKKLFACLGLCLIVFVQLLGVGYMALISGLYLNTPLPFSRAVYLILIFIPLDVFKFAFASVFALQLRKRLPRIFGRAAMQKA